MGWHNFPKFRSASLSYADCRLELCGAILILFKVAPARDAAVENSKSDPAIHTHEKAVDDRHEVGNRYLRRTKQPKTTTAKITGGRPSGPDPL